MNRPTDMSPADRENHDRQAIAALVESYRLGFETMDVDRLASIWDQDYGDLIYVALEAASPIRGREGIAKYYRRVAGQFEAVMRMSVDDLSVDILGDAAFAWCTFHFAAVFKGRREPHLADARVTFLFRRSQAGWRVIHYHESCPGPLPDPLADPY